MYKDAYIQRIFWTCNSLDFIIKHLMCLLVPVLKMCAYLNVLTCRSQKWFWESVCQMSCFCSDTRQPVYLNWVLGWFWVFFS